MKSNTMNKMMVMVLACFSLTACIDHEKNRLENRAEAFWQHKINKEFKQAYEFLSPGWRKTDSLEAFEQRMLISKANWKGSKLSKKECSQPDLCVVTMAIQYEYKFKTSGSQKMQIESMVRETWILKDNVWYHLPLQKKLGQ